MRRVLILLLLPGILSAAAPPAEEPLALGGIALLQSEATVLRTLGPPERRSETPENFMPLELSYPGLTVLLDEQGVGGLTSTSEKYCTVAGACPGMSWAEVERIYGDALRERAEGVSTWWVEGEDCWMEFTHASGKVDEIAVKCPV
jgi:hypothetical protein